MWAFLVNPPEGGKGMRSSNPMTKGGRKYKSLVKRLGVKQAAMEYRKWKREQKGKGSQATARKGGSNMARKNPKGIPKTARGKAYREVVKRYGVIKGAKIWRGMKKPALAAKKGPKRKGYSANPKGYPKTATGKAYRALVKQYGVIRAAQIWRSRGKGGKKKYAANAWKGDRKGHSIASAAGWARRKGIPVPLYLGQKGFSRAEIDRYIGRHGAVGESHRPYTTHHPVPAGRRYAMNPVATAVETVKGVLSMETAKIAIGVGSGFLGMALGNAVVKKIKPDAKVPVIVGGEIAGSMLAGAVYATITKDVGKGILTAGSGITLSVFKLAWTKFMAGKTILGLSMPGLGDYVELPYAAGISDYVELPYAAGMGQPLHTDMGQFLPASAAEVGQFIPEQFGEYTVGIGEEAEVEY